MSIKRLTTSSISSSNKNSNFTDPTASASDIFNDGSTVLHYALDGNFNDSMGNASGYTTSGVSSLPGKIGSCYRWYQGQAYKDVTNIMNGNGARSYSMWTFLDGSGAGQRQLLFGQGSFGTNNNNFDFEANCYHNGTISDSYGIHWWGNGIKFDSATVIYGQWVHLVVTQAAGGSISQGSTKGYVNNVQKTLNNYTTSSYSIQSSSRICIGTRTYSGASVDLPTFGKIDQIRIFNKELSAAEVSTLYNLGRGR